MTYANKNTKLTDSKEKITEKFSCFMDIANDLTTSYYQLQTKVDTLTEQLAQASRERMLNLLKKNVLLIVFNISYLYCQLVLLS